MKIALSQINTTIGDFEGNRAKILERMRWAEGKGANIILFPELTVCGYPPKDLLEKPSFIRHNRESVDEIARQTGRMAVAIGFVSPNESSEGRPHFNSMGLLMDGRVQFVQHKSLLPEYDVFDEGRYFEPATQHRVFEIAGKKIGLTTCEDLWNLFDFGGRTIYHHDPMACLAKAGADIVLNGSASPFTITKQDIRRDLVTRASAAHGIPIMYCNMIGGNDDLVFDGRSFATDSKGRIVCEAGAFVEDTIVVDLNDMKPLKKLPEIPVEDEVHRALVLGLRDYMRKCGFDRAVVGLSGGIDSSIVAAIACEAIGPRNVIGAMLPSPFTSETSNKDAERLASNLGMSTRIVPIGEIYDAFRKSLGYVQDINKVSIVEENIQARIRGTILMAISNQENALVLSTGNKSELSVGYCTLYGDMVGGFALISDVPKTMIYALARHLNSKKEIIPKEIIKRPPTAELKPGQKDSDALPPYDKLDPIIAAYVEERQDSDEMVKSGFDRKIVERVVDMIDRNEYKRRQAAPGIKITSKAFGQGRRFPLARKY